MFRKSLLLAVLLATTMTNGLTSQIFQPSHQLSSAVENQSDWDCQDRLPSDQPAQLWNFSDEAPRKSNSTQPLAKRPQPAAPEVTPVETPKTVEAPTTPSPQVVEALEAKTLPTFEPLAFDAPVQTDPIELELPLSREPETNLGTLGELPVRLEHEEITADLVLPPLKTETVQRFETPTVTPEFAAAPVLTEPATIIRNSEPAERTRKAAAWWWSLALLPMLGLLGWLFGRKQESEMMVVATREREQELEGSFRGPVAAASQTDLEVTDLEVTDLEVTDLDVDFEAVETPREEINDGITRQPAVASLQTPAVQIPKVETTECKIGASQPAGEVTNELTKIEGLSAKQVDCLSAAGICTLSQFKNTKPEEIQRLFVESGLPKCDSSEVGQWFTLAEYGKKNDWVGLRNNQKASLTSSRTETSGETETTVDSDSTCETYTASKAENQTCDARTTVDRSATGSSLPSDDCDDLTKINGIGPASAKLLRENGITRFDQLISVHDGWLEDLFKCSGTQFTTVDWTTWSQQAQFASTGDWDGLRTWFETNCASATGRSRKRVRVNKGSKSKRSWRVLNQKSSSDSKSKKSETQSRSKQSVAGNGATGSSLTSDGCDDLTKINGIGPASAKLLKRNGITRFEQLVSCDENLLERLFKNSGTLFTTWSKQAKFASTGDWDGLRQWFLKNESSIRKSQTTLSGVSKTSKSNSTSTKTPANENARTASASDNLTVISGIGPATAKVLKANGITRFEQIAVMSGPQLESIISGSGARFQLVDPTSWPQQANALLKDLGRTTTIESSLLSEINELQSLQAQRPEAQSRQTEKESVASSSEG